MSTITLREFKNVLNYIDELKITKFKEEVSEIKNKITEIIYVYSSILHINNVFVERENESKNFLKFPKDFKKLIIQYQSVVDRVKLRKKSIDLSEYKPFFEEVKENLIKIIKELQNLQSVKQSEINLSKEILELIKGRSWYGGVKKDTFYYLIEQLIDMVEDLGKKMSRYNYNKGKKIPFEKVFNYLPRFQSNSSIRGGAISFLFSKLPKFLKKLESDENNLIIKNILHQHHKEEASFLLTDLFRLRRVINLLIKLEVIMVEKFKFEKSVVNKTLIKMKSGPYIDLGERGALSLIEYSGGLSLSE
jgi:hypothetical protein